MARSGTGRQRSPLPRPAASHSTLPITPAGSDPTETSPISPRHKGPGPGFPLPKWIQPLPSHRGPGAEQSGRAPGPGRAGGPRSSPWCRWCRRRRQQRMSPAASPPPPAAAAPSGTRRQPMASATAAPGANGGRGRRALLQSEAEAGLRGAEGRAGAAGRRRPGLRGGCCSFKERGRD